MTRHTLPDYTGKYKQATVFGQVDNGELAARLGASSRFDRRGQTVWHDDYEAAILRWETILNSALTTISLRNTRALTGEQSMLIHAGADAGNFGRAQRYLAYPVLSKMGFEVSNTYSATIDRIEWKMHLYTGTDVYWAAVEWENATNSLFYKDITDDAVQFPTGTTTLLSANVDPNVSVWGFMNAKLVADFETGYYTRFILDDTTYDMSNLQMFTEAEGVTSPVMILEVGLDGSDAGGGTASDVYYDGAILTQNEDI